MFYFDPLYFLFMLPGLALALIAQSLVSFSYKRNSKIFNAKGITGAEAARLILNANGITDVRIGRVKGNLTDNYNPSDNTIYLSSGVFDSSSVAAVGIAAHETGHALQHSFDYKPIKARKTLVPVCNFGASVSPFLIIAGYLFQAEFLLWAAIGVFGLSVLFMLVTLPVEFNASSRAMKAIRENNILNEQDAARARGVLTAAAFTYVAALFQSLLIFIYYFIRFSGRRN